MLIHSIYDVHDQGQLNSLAETIEFIESFTFAFMKPCRMCLQASPSEDYVYIEQPLMRLQVGVSAIIQVYAKRSPSEYRVRDISELVGLLICVQIV